MDSAEPELAKLAFRYHMDHPDPRSIKFDDFAKKVTEAASALLAIRPNTVSSSLLPVAASMTASTPDLNVKAELQEMRTMFKACMAQMNPQAASGAACLVSNKRPTAPTTGIKRIDSSKRRPQFSDWCWTHGLCSHKSQDCRNPASGHRGDATPTNTRGGAPTDRRAGRR